MSNVIRFGHDLAKPLTPKQQLFMVRQMRREAAHKVLAQEDRALVNRLLDEVEAEVTPHC